MEITVSSPGSPGTSFTDNVKDKILIIFDVLAKNEDFASVHDLGIELEKYGMNWNYARNILPFLQNCGIVNYQDVAAIVPGNSPQTQHMAGRAHERWRMKDGVHVRNKRDVWTVSTKPYRGAHFATFPPELIRPCILAGSRPGGIVLDPFFGSGTTGVVAKEEGRGFIGIDVNAGYIEMAKDRVSEVKK